MEVPHRVSAGQVLKIRLFCGDSCHEFQQCLRYAAGKGPQAGLVGACRDQGRLILDREQVPQFRDQVRLVRLGGLGKVQRKIGHKHD